MREEKTPVFENGCREGRIQAYVYENSGDEMKKDQFPKAARYRFAEIAQATGLPEGAKREYDDLWSAVSYIRTRMSGTR